MRAHNIDIEIRMKYGAAVFSILRTMHTEWRQQKKNNRQQQQQRADGINETHFPYSTKSSSTKFWLFRRSQCDCCVYLLDSCRCVIFVTNIFVRAVLLYIFFWKRIFPVCSLRDLNNSSNKSWKRNRKTWIILARKNIASAYKCKYTSKCYCWNRSRCLQLSARTENVCVCEIKFGNLDDC